MKHCLHKHSREEPRQLKLSLWKTFFFFLIFYFAQHFASGSLGFRKQYFTFHFAGYGIFKLSDESRQGLRICCLAYEISYRHVDKVLLKNEGTPAASLSIAHISTELTE